MLFIPPGAHFNHNSDSSEKVILLKCIYWPPDGHVLFRWHTGYQFRRFGFVVFWLGIWCESLVWVIMGRQGVSQNASVLVVLVMSALYLLQYLLDPFHIYTYYQATVDGVWHVLLLSEVKKWSFGKFLKFLSLILPCFDLGSDMNQ